MEYKKTKTFCGILPVIYIISVTAIKIFRREIKEATVSKLYEIQNLDLE